MFLSAYVPPLLDISSDRCLQFLFGDSPAEIWRGPKFFFPESLLSVLYDDHNFIKSITYKKKKKKCDLPVVTLSKFVGRKVPIIIIPRINIFKYILNGTL